VGWCGVVWCGLVCGLVWAGVWVGVWVGVVWCGAVRCGAVRCGVVSCRVVSCGVVWCGVRVRVRVRVRVSKAGLAITSDLMSGRERWLRGGQRKVLRVVLRNPRCECMSVV